MTSNLPSTQKTNWVDSDIVMPADTNAWGTAINTLSADIPLYAHTGNFYTATFSSNIYTLTPLSGNATLSAYTNGMSVSFFCPAVNTDSCKVKIGSLNAVNIKDMNNLNLSASALRQGELVSLVYDSVNFCFKVSTLYASISLDNLNSVGLKKILPTQTGHNGHILTTDGTNASWVEKPSSRNIGEIVSSTMPLVDAGLHLLDGALISGSGSYADFVSYMYNLYLINPQASYFAQDIDDVLPVEDTFIQPVLSANGTMGGSSFAVECNGYNSTDDIWKAFDGDNSTVYCSSAGMPKWFTFYNPEPLKVSKLTITNVNNNNPKITGYTILASNDNINWVTLMSGTNSNTTAGASWDINVNAQNYFNYYRVNVTSVWTTGGHYSIVANCQITATYISTPATVHQTAEEWWQEQVATYGVCDKFVYDSVNNTVRLPKYGNQAFTSLPSTLPVKGTGKTLGLTNGTSLIGINSSAVQTNRDMFVTDAYNVNVTTSTSSATGVLGKLGVTTDGTKSGIVADLSSGLTNYPLNCYYYIVIATTAKTSIEVDIDEIATDLNGKADVDLTNINATGQIAIAHNAMPSFTYESLTIGASGSNYIAPTDGYFSFHAQATSTNAFISMYVSASNNDVLYGYKQNCNVNTQHLYATIPVKKGQTVTHSYGNVSNNYGYFIYAVGSESEA